MKRLPLFIACICGLLATANNAQAQSWKDVLKKENVSKTVDAVKDVTGIGTIKDITGTWSYNKSAISFESDNLLNKAGGALASSKVEAKLDEQLAMAGVKPGTTTFTFNEDRTFSCKTQEHALKGTYNYDSSKGVINLKFVGFIGIAADVTGSSHTMTMLFDSDKLLTLVTILGGSINNTTIQAITSIARSYDGMRMGLEMKR